ncbi:hypothetical protein BP6252_04112 [Coleophoma cylindrospora]|uniref:NAD(P)-binding domain-containing protein n=1 Tax=Coleophoma cylindrospora TaxID=1849047 RepID=A0A3D8S049_9HELO|nr:hypothetical protein BP6252_04112 [Coleophoma cylindrospora]
MPSTATIAIAGFTGKMARLITNSLLQNNPTVKIHGICRAPEKVDARIRAHPNVKIFASTATDTAALRQARAGASVFICFYLGDNTLMVEGQKTLIDSCIDEGAYLEVKEKDGKIKGVHVLNGTFMEAAFASFLGYVDAAAAVFRCYGDDTVPLELTTYADAARYSSEVAIDPSANGFVTGEKVPTRPKLDADA